ncbi:MAG: hypothetical protein Q7S66_00065 [bacterium]|nr:hypothetical protein [bacterium]
MNDTRFINKIVGMMSVLTLTIFGTIGLVGSVQAIVVDTDNPVISNLIADKSVAGYRKFSAKATDAVDTALSCKLEYEGTPNNWTFQANMSQSGTTYSAANVPIGAATMNWRVSCTDDAPHTTTLSKSFTFTSPLVGAMGIKNRINAGKRQIFAWAPDFNNITTAVDGSCKFYLDNVFKSTGYESDVNSSYYYSGVITVYVGSHTAKAECTNNANMTHTKEYTWTAATPAAPTITQTPNANGTASTFSVTAYDYDDPTVIDTCALTVDGQNQGVVTESNVNYGVFASGSVTLSQGQHTAVVTCNNGIGNTGQGSVTFTLAGPDTTKPVLQSFSVDSTAPGARTLTVIATDDRDTNLVCYFDFDHALDGPPPGADFTQNGGSTSYIKTGYNVAAGQHTFRAFCTDDAGNYGTLTQTWTFATLPADTQAPVVQTITVDATTPGLRDFTATATDNIDTDLNCQLTIDQTPSGLLNLTLPGSNTYVANDVNISAGQHTIKVDCMDDPSNQGEKIVTITFAAAPADSTAPAVSSITPSILTSGFGSITAVATDNIDTNLQCTLLFTNDQLAVAMTKTGAGSYTRNNMLFQSGQNTALVECRDDAGLSGSRSYTWTVANTGGLPADPPPGDNTVINDGGTGAGANTTATLPPSCPTLYPADMVRVSGHAAIYTLNNNFEVLFFPTGDEFKSWNADDRYAGYYKLIDQTCFDDLKVPRALPTAVNFRPGSYIIKREYTDQLFVVLPANKLAKITASDAAALYGSNYKVKVIAESFWRQYTGRGADIIGRAHEGMLIRQDGKVWRVGPGTILREITDRGLNDNRFKEIFVHTVPSAYLQGYTYSAESIINALDSTISNRAQ